MPATILSEINARETRVHSERRRRRNTARSSGDTIFCVCIYICMHVRATTTDRKYELCVQDLRKKKLKKEWKKSRIKAAFRATRRDDDDDGGVINRTSELMIWFSLKLMNLGVL